MADLRLLLVDDEQIALDNLADALDGQGFLIETAPGGEAAQVAIRRSQFDLVITDLRMPGVDGLAVLASALEHNPDTLVILLTGHATVDTAVTALRAGAYHYLTKPYRLEELRAAVAGARERLLARRSTRTEPPAVSSGPIVTCSEIMQRVLATAASIAPSESNVVILGESGTGKELLAREIHRLSHRHDQPFLAVNCGALSEELLDSALFGHEAGAFTGAVKARRGYFETASGGTLFLDEFAEMSPAMQVKLLRVIENREVLPVGAERPRPVDVRLVVATNRSLEREVAEGRMRRDLYYRVSVVTLELPPLRRRKEDVPLLAQHLLRRHCESSGRNVQGFSDAALELLMAYDFPGNVRELSNIIERAVLLTEGTLIEVGNLPDNLRRLRVTMPASAAMASLEDQEISAIKRALAETGGHRGRAAELLGIDRVSLWRKMKRYGIEA
ncbi:sigma-54-dependent transcriptional regulator [Thioalkalivibrio sulfidiphilus]|uniref:Response regulator receiver protein n=1 Tax=Thioalkalivibrio sulfidiphilus (strain HL-EbGR7) TaxID=396588 RepID=B8GSN1_THISH|nr:sigma-54 dependent transcriptional regulator [Thioalkalivibrio sulfidiphilus]ACL72935.1 response regulator receiver protein [Thioalkalivibrio sulfidiphilus HL-EbGr7]